MNNKVKYTSMIIAVALVLIISNKINSQLLQETTNNIINQELLDCYEADHDEEIIIASQMDLNMDKKEDAVIIYKESDKANKMTIVLTKGYRHYLTKPVPAPMENQTIKFKNIDEKNQMEVIVSGEKHGNIGFAIFRIEDGEALDIFGEGMESCC